MEKLRIKYLQGKIELLPPDAAAMIPAEVRKDLGFSAKPPYVSFAANFRRTYTWLNRAKQHFTIEGREDWKLTLALKALPSLHPYQDEALTAWLATKKGRLEIPTGGGKTVIAAHILAAIAGSSLILVPTIDLLHQWKKRLEEYFAFEVGMIGDGNKSIQPLCVSTYDSAQIYAAELGAKFALLVLDEVHHASSLSNILTLKQFLAPYRLGLSATMPEDKERDTELNLWVGKIVFQLTMQDLEGDFLSPFSVKKIFVEMTAEERQNYDTSRQVYLDYRAKHNLPAQLPWKSFVFHAYNSKEGKNALAKFKEQKEIAANASAKIEALQQILSKHSTERILIFTNDNKSARLVSALCKVPILIHNTKKKERKELLAMFAAGTERVLVSSRVLNEGIDVPEASVAVIYSGTATTREHTQRLGRILRKKNQQARHFL